MSLKDSKAYLEFNRAQTGLAIDDNVLGECITCDFVCFTTLEKKD